MSGRDRRALKKLQAEHRQKAIVPEVPHTADLPAIHQHPDCPPLDVAMLTMPIELSPNLGAPARSTPVPTVHPPVSRREIPSGHAGAVVEVATRLMERLVDQYGRAALNATDVHDCVDTASELVQAARR